MTLNEGSPYSKLHYTTLKNLGLVCSVKWTKHEAFLRKNIIRLNFFQDRLVPYALSSAFPTG